MVLVQTQTYKADKLLGVEEKEFKYVLKTHESVDPLEPGESDSYDVTFEIPALPPSELKLCTKIDIGYSIQVNQNMNTYKTSFSIFRLRCHQKAVI